MFRILKRLLSLFRPKKSRRWDKTELDKYLMSRRPQTNAEVDFYTRQFENVSKHRSAWWEE